MDSLQQVVGFDVFMFLIFLWFMKSYIFHWKMTKEEAFIVEKAPKWLLYPLTLLFCFMILLVIAVDMGWLPEEQRGQIYRFTDAAFMGWICLVLYTKWNWGIHVTDRKLRVRNQKQMFFLLIVLIFLLALL